MQGTWPEMKNKWSNSEMFGGRSFKDVVLNRMEQRSNKELFLNSYRSQPMGIWGVEVLIGRMKDLMSLNNLGVWASTVKGTSNLRYLGGLHVMISFKNKVDADSILSDCSKWEQWFTKLKTWEEVYLSRYVHI
ncbi:hypothetical protein E3N88_29885 [Mikania micrantha]|uniref:DUF4283 domain-containing protein n=1 Tax=Mikania micrantha TaxID=192012 RepID=A0A5N6MKU2_9ASTR|nr:hypothetical protein E3N88_29885 [Mikania micrantha]